MSGARTALLLSVALASAFCFNLDTEKLTTFRMPSTGFGHSVAQYASSWVVVGAPQEITAPNQTGGLYQCDYGSGLCVPIQLQVPPEAVNMSLGLSLAASTSPSQLLACGPTVQHACRENMHLTGFCFLLDQTSQQPRMFPTALQECPKLEQDIVFLIDGSGSISFSNFATMKNFVKAVMSQFPRPSTQFSLMQFSNEFQTHFTFNDFVSSTNPLQLLDRVYQLMGTTHTATAILRVVDQLFHASTGARKDATKILIVITDGQKLDDPLGYEDVIPKAEAAGIIRYAIGVGLAFQVVSSLRELHDIASEPAHEHVFRVENFDALRDIQGRLKEKIFAIEGTETMKSSAFELEMSQEGFSAVLTPEGPVLGAVGSFDWSGGAFLYPPGGSPTFINMSQQNVDMRDSYLGYSSQLVLWKGVQSLVLGAPRYEHTGKVVLFTQTSTHWEMRAEVTGTQIGSYFGSSLCSVDVDRDGSTDLVLIGAPHYYEQTRGGRVSVCPLPRGQAPWRCERVLRGEQGHPWGRFGAALTVLGDVNGDKLADVAIGAPGEQENRGAVYLFHGAPGLDMSPTHSQHIAGTQLSPRLQYFGQALSGGQDLTQDGLVDLAVGAQGQVLLLRSQPVLKVGVAMRFSPVEVAKAVFQHCREASGALEAGEATVCLTVHKTSPDQLGDVQSSISYDLALDPGRLVSRAIFQETQNQTLTRRKTLGLGRHCETMRLLLPDCVEDVVNPIVLHLNFSLEGQPILSSQNLRPVLATGSQDHFIASLPFEKNCGQDRLCEGDLSISFNFSGLNTLLVGLSLELTVTVTVRNEGEDSYGTAITLYYPAGLSYRRVSGQTQPWQRPLHLACEAVPTESEGLRSTSCSVNHPIFQGGAQGTFVVKFDVSSKASLGDRLLMGASASSENNKPASNKTSFELELPVKYAVYMMITRHEGSTRFFNFSTSAEKSSKEAEHRYRVNNLSLRDVAVSVDFWAPVQLNGAAVWDVAVEAPAQSLPCAREREPPRTSDLSRVPGSPVLDCSVAHCLRFRCHIPSFSAKEELHFTLKGNLSFAWVSQMLQKKVSVVSVAEITFNRAVYSQVPGEEPFMRAQVETVLEEYEEHDPVPLVVGSCVGGLLLLALISATLYKLGFFKRRYKEMLGEKPGDAATFPGEDASCGASDLPLSQ